MHAQAGEALSETPLRFTSRQNRAAQYPDRWRFSRKVRGGGGVNGDNHPIRQIRAETTFFSWERCRTRTQFRINIHIPEAERDRSPNSSAGRRRVRGLSNRRSSLTGSPSIIPLQHTRARGKPRTSPYGFFPHRLRCCSVPLAGGEVPETRNTGAERRFVAMRPEAGMAMTYNNKMVVGT